MEFSDFAKQRPRDFGGSTPPKSPWASQKPPLFAYRKRVYREPAFDCGGAVKRNAPPEKASKQQSEADVTKKIALCGQKNRPQQKLEAIMCAALRCWRRKRDSNPRAGYPTYSLSRGAPSPLGYFSKCRTSLFNHKKHYTTSPHVCQYLFTFYTAKNCRT